MLEARLVWSQPKRSGNIEVQARQIVFADSVIAQPPEDEA